MNQYKKHQINQEIAKELNAFGFHIQTLRPKIKLSKGQLLSYDDCPCELLELIGITENKELWQVKFLDDPEPAFIYL